MTATLREAGTGRVVTRGTVATAIVTEATLLRASLTLTAEAAALLTLTAEILCSGFVRLTVPLAVAFLATDVAVTAVRRAVMETGTAIVAVAGEG